MRLLRALEYSNCFCSYNRFSDKIVIYTFSENVNIIYSDKVFILIIDEFHNFFFIYFDVKNAALRKCLSSLCSNTYLTVLKKITEKIEK